MAPRVDPADDLAGREDRPAAPAKKKVSPTDPIGNDGARKLLDLATRKKVRLENYLAPASVNQFQPLSEISKEVARNIYRQLQALPDPPAALPASPPPVTANGQARGKTTGQPTALLAPAAPVAPASVSSLPAARKAPSAPF